MNKRQHSLLMLAFSLNPAACDAPGGNSPDEPHDNRSAETSPTEAGDPLLTDATILPAGPVISAPNRPLTGRTLETSANGHWALSTDPTSGEIAILELDISLTHSLLAIDTNWEPGPVALDNSRGYVLLQGTGELMMVGLQSASLEERAVVCPSPEGLVLADDVVHVTCRGGQLVSFDAASLKETRRVWVEEDLRDVVPWGDGLVVSLFRTAELLFLDEAGAVTRRLFPRSDEGLKPAVAWKMRRRPDGKIALGHQLNATGLIGGPASRGYSVESSCGSVVAPAISVIDPNHDPAPLEPGDRPKPAPGQDPDSHFTVEQSILSGSGGMFDFAFSGATAHLAVPGNALRYGVRQFEPGPRPSLIGMIPALGLGEPVCESTLQGTVWPDIPIAVAPILAGHWEEHVLVQTLAPKGFYVISGAPAGSLGREETREDIVRRSLPIRADVQVDSGMRLFHLSVDTGIACASCHPMGRTDAHVWNFAKTGPRRTQALAGGLANTGAFHWDAEFSDFGAFIDDVMTARMGLDLWVPSEHQEALLTFINEIPRTPPQKRLDSSAVTRGEDLFFSDRTHCGDCHNGPTLTDDRIYDVGTGGFFVTPSLVGVAERAPYLHDGCARDLTERFGLCGGGDQHGKTSQLDDTEIADLVEFMRSL